LRTKTAQYPYRLLFVMSAAAAIALSLAGCADTFEGAKQDTARDTQNAQHNLNTAGKAISNTANSAGQAISNTANSVAN
jgi:predicted small secreted protein